MAITLTCVLNLYSLPFPNIVNPIRVDVATQANPTAIVATQTDTASGHPARVWSFPGLERTNYIVTMNEIDGSGNPLNQLAYFDVVPDSLMVYTVRNDEQIFPDITPGFTSGANVVYFDGGTVGGTTGSTIQVNQTGNLGPINNVYSWYFSLKGNVATNATVQVNFTYDDNGQGLHSASVTSTVQSGWTLANVVTDLYNKMSAIASNVLYYTDSDNYSGVRVRSLTNNSGSVVITNIPSTPGSQRPDYRGWNINPERRAGRGTMQRDVEYSWDTVSGKFSLLQVGDIFLPQELYNIDFDPLASPAGGSVPAAAGSAFTNKLITNNYTILATDFGTNLIVEPNSGYIELTLPPASGIAEGLPVRIEVYKTTSCCVKIVGSVVFPFGANIFMLSGESIEIFVFVRTPGNNEYRYKNAFGNYDKVGMSIFADRAPLNALQLNGTQCDILFHARLWQWIQGIPAAQKVTYAAWANSKTFFSLASGNSFYIPDRSALYARTAGNGEQLNSLMLQQISKHKHTDPFSSSFSSSSGGLPFGGCNFSGSAKNKLGSGSEDHDNDWWFTNDGTEISGASQMNPAGLIGGETRPNSYVINQYILL